jgi:drug/metabolite transporter (DMT)-like permease
LILWGLGPPVSKLITAPPLTASFLRLWSSTAGIMALQLGKGSRPSWPILRGSLLGGAAFGFNSLFFFIALKNASIATITVIGALQPGLVMLLAARIFHETVTRRVVGFTMIAIGGAALAVLGAGAAVETNTVGVLCSIGSLLCMSVYFLASKHARVRLGAGDYVTGVMLVASITATPVIWLGGGFDHFDQVSRTDIFWLIVMLIGPGVGGQLLMGWALRWVPVTTSAMILLGSTAISILAAWPIHGEVPTLLQLLGGAIALISVGLILNSSRT